MKISRKILSTLLLSFFIVLFSCSEDEPAPTVQKIAKIEVELAGSFENYLTSFSMLNLIRGLNEQIGASIISPDIEWTQVITQANTYSITVEPTFDLLVAQSDLEVKTVTFLFQATHNGSTPSDDFEPLRATIKVYGDNSLVETFTYTAAGPGGVSQSLTETVSF